MGSGGSLPLSGCYDFMMNPSDQPPDGEHPDNRKEKQGKPTPKRLSTLELHGWKSIRRVKLALRPLNVLVGANGAGKSNLLAVFDVLNQLVANSPGFARFVGRQGGADRILRGGSIQTPIAGVQLTFETQTGVNGYNASWAAAAGDSLIFTDEGVSFWGRNHPEPYERSLGAGHAESRLPLYSPEDETVRIVLSQLRQCRYFHFHDTSPEGPLRRPCSVDQDRFLQGDGHNLPAILYGYQQSSPQTLARIENAIRTVVPGFARFLLEPTRRSPDKIALRWLCPGSEYELSAAQLSDGTVRLIALATLLLQPEDELPLLITLDEPELGLHPAAIGLLQSMMRTAARRCQIVMATQSVPLVNYFQPDEILVAQSTPEGSEFKQYEADEFSDWLEEYELGELIEKNVIPAGPFA